MNSLRPLLLFAVGITLLALLAWWQRPPGTIAEEAAVGDSASGLSEHERKRLREQLRDHSGGMARVVDRGSNLAELERTKR
ncbi:MAG: hypothetical protein R3E83_17230 [Burkholderiaceae bacterium]